MSWWERLERSNNFWGGVNMNRLKKWVVKLDTVWIIFICIVFLVFVSTLEMDASIKSIYTLLGIPVFLFILQNVMQKKQENNCYNVDLYMKENVENEIIWRLRTDNSQNDIAYLCIKNTGKIDIFSMYIKVTKNDGAIGWFQISEMLNIDKECVVCVPYRKENIKEIVLTCSVQTECRTKKFNGIQSGNQNMTIFSNSELLDAEKYAIYHEKGFDVFEKMERFLV